jgi:hypothetical protein
MKTSSMQLGHFIIHGHFEFSAASKGSLELEGNFGAFHGMGAMKNLQSIGKISG